MSILIKGMKMPTCCEECAFIKVIGLDRWKCELSGCDFNWWDVGWRDEEENKYIRHSSCPLVGLPPHGRLIDADALPISIEVPLNGKSFRYVHLNNINNAPTVIPAEEGE